MMARVYIEIVDGVEGKKCSGCGKWSPLTNFHLGSGVGKRGSVCKGCRNTTTNYHSKVTEVNGISGKSCKKCGEWKGLEEYHRGTAAGGRKTDCIACRNKRGHRIERQEVETKNGILGKECKKCYVWKPLTKFNKGHSAGGKSFFCKGCLSVLRKASYEKNKEVENLRSTLWEKENRERVLTRRRLKYKEYRVHKLNRRARQRYLKNDFTIKQRESIFKRFNYSCALTGVSEEVHWDHVIPLATGHGGTTYSNMIPLHSTLNLSKNDQNIFEWFNKNKVKFELSEERFNSLIDWIASNNHMSYAEYKKYVYWCHENTPEEITNQIKGVKDA